MSPKTIDRIRDFVSVLYAIELLEYHDKNHLYFGTDPAKLSREKQHIFRQLGELLPEYVPQKATKAGPWGYLIIRDGQEYELTQEEMVGAANTLQKNAELRDMQKTHRGEGGS